MGLCGERVDRHGFGGARGEVCLLGVELSMDGSGLKGIANGAVNEHVTIVPQLLNFGLTFRFWTFGLLNSGSVVVAKS